MALAPAPLLCLLLLTACTAEGQEELTWEEACVMLVDDPVDLVAADLGDGRVELTWESEHLGAEGEAYRVYRREVTETSETAEVGPSPDVAPEWSLVAGLELPEGAEPRFVDQPPDLAVEYRMARVWDCGGTEVEGAWYDDELGAEQVARPVPTPAADQ